MKRFVCAHDTEIVGHALYPFLRSLAQEAVQPLLEKHKLLPLEAERWYPLQDWLNVLNDLSSQEGAMFDLVAIGLAVAANVPLPPEASAVPFEVFFLQMYPVSYKVQFRNTQPGWVEAVKVSEKHLLFRVDNPFPPNLVYGTIYGFARRLMPAGLHFTVQFEDDMPPPPDFEGVLHVHLIWD